MSMNAAAERKLSPPLRERTLAVVVTYNPDACLCRNLDALRVEVDAVVVVDNGSANAEWVERTALAAGCRPILNGANLGVATALNQGARLALAEGFDWLATFDQDSLIAPGALAGLIDVYDEHPERERIAILAMSRRDRVTGRPYSWPWEILSVTPQWRSVRSTITSGCLVRTAVFASVGFFDDKLFIDAVDHEFCLRCRRNGHRVIEVLTQVIEHSLGASTEIRILWWRIYCRNHSTVRRYYITRNRLEVCARYILFDFVWVGFSFVALAVENLIALLFEAGRPGKASAIFAGTRDFFFRRFGPRP